MYELPDFTPYGYRLLEVLSNNIQGGRITYKAIQLSNNDYVVIKQFRFASSGNWSVYKQVEREINVLQGLEHPGISKYLDTIDHPEGICSVQQYINAPNLSISRSFDPEQIKNIAIQCLEILVYLQNRIPPIIHRDIKPENVLYYAEKDQVYLVDFGLAKIGNNDSALSSMVAGTPGFMPPEQLLGKTLSNASDLYGLGATIICLMTGTKSTQLNDLINHDFSINFKPLVSQYNMQLVDWLDKMVNPDMDERFFNAKKALDAVTVIENLARVPEVTIYPSELRFIEMKRGEILTETLIVTNKVPDTMLKGKWSVYPHPNDPPHTPDDHAWISFEPKEFEGNNIKCKVTVDTSKLKADKVGERIIFLRSNAVFTDYPVTLRVKTDPIPIATKKPPYLILIACLIICVVNYRFIFQNPSQITISMNLPTVIFWIFYIVFQHKILQSKYLYWLDVMSCTAISLSISGAIGMAISMAFFGDKVIILASSILLYSTIIWGGALMAKREFTLVEIIIYILLIFILGTSIGWLSIAGINIYAILALGSSAAVLIPKLINAPKKQKQLIEQWQKKEQYLIEP